MSSEVKRLSVSHRGENLWRGNLQSHYASLGHALGVVRHCSPKVGWRGILLWHHDLDISLGQK